MRILVTGVNGFVGSHLVEELARRNHQIVGVGMQSRPTSSVSDMLDDYLSVDLTDLARVKTLPLGEIDGIISLAGLADVGRSFKESELYMKVNRAVISNVSDALEATGNKSIRHLAISTGAVYDRFQNLPFSEESQIATEGSPYVMSKIAMEKDCVEYRSRGLQIIIARPFNHVGPGQERGFLLPDLYDKVRQAISGAGFMEVGNLETRRDYTDVRDVVRAYTELITKPKVAHSTYNVCSGQSTSGRQLLDYLFDAMGLAGQVELKVDLSLIRPNDPLEIYGSSQLLKDETGWTPKIDLKTTIADFVASKESSD